MVEKSSIMADMNALKQLYSNKLLNLAAPSDCQTSCTIGCQMNDLECYRAQCDFLCGNWQPMPDISPNNVIAAE